MSPPTDNQRCRRTDHRFYAEIVTDITTLNRDPDIQMFTKMYVGYPI